MSNHEFDVARLIKDLGGPSAVARAIGVVRTTPYAWIKRNYLSSPFMARLYDAFPAVDFNQYFVPKGKGKLDEHGRKRDGSARSGA